MSTRKKRTARKSATTGGRPKKKVAGRPASKPSAPQRPARPKSTRGAATKPASRKAAGKSAPPGPRAGAVAPDFTAVGHDGSAIRLSAFRGRPVVLYFYPKDDTPGCTVEACGFRDAHAALARRGAVVLGVSPDSPQSHVRFRTKHALPFTLVADEAHAVAEAYGVWRQKSLYGRKFMGVVRSTFVIDATGRIAKIFATVKPQGHAAEVLAAVAALE